MNDFLKIITLGHHEYDDSAKPKKILQFGPTSVLSFSAGLAHSAAITGIGSWFECGFYSRKLEDGCPWTWGSNHQMQVFLFILSLETHFSSKNLLQLTREEDKEDYGIILELFFIVLSNCISQNSICKGYLGRFRSTQLSYSC
jgi:hypothetical protein